MNKILALSLIILGMSSCVTTSPPQRGDGGTVSNARTVSIEAEARKKTEDMDKLLVLSATQKDDILVTNTVYLKVVKNLQDNNETSKLAAAKESYLNKLKSILTTLQYSKFESEMGG